MVTMLLCGCLKNIFADCMLVAGKIKGISPMPMFTTRSLGYLMQCHEDLQLLFFEVVRGIDCVVIDVPQIELPSMAINVVPYEHDLEHNLTVLDKQRFCYFAGYVMGVASRLHAEGKMLYRLRWGGEFVDDNLGFFELKG